MFGEDIRSDGYKCFFSRPQFAGNLYLPPKCEHVIFQNMKQETATKMNILVVEDEPDVAMAMRFALGLANCEAQIAETKAEAMEMAESGNFDLITLDVNLRGASGLQICRKLKENPRLKNTPIVMVSGRNSLEDQQNGLGAGAVDYITKPFDTFEFGPRILSHIEAQKVAG